MPESAENAYAVVHLVAGESMKDLIGPQVIDHMTWQTRANGSDRPARIGVGLIEAARVTVSASFRARVRELRARASSLRVMRLPIVGRLGLRPNARVMARRIRGFAGRLPVVFHCRGESAVEWASAMTGHLEATGIVADIRGAWPEELLFARGFDGPDEADPAALRAYHYHMSRLHQALGGAGAVMSVSPGMLDWLHGLGVARQLLSYVPCCVTRVVAEPEAMRAAARARLGLEGRLVLCYLGSITRYQHLEDGVVPFVRACFAESAAAHLLCVTSEPERMREVLHRGGLAHSRTSIVSVSQSDTPSVVSAADCGMLLRAPSRMNRFSQPIKLAEYLASGVPVIVARGTGRVDTLLEESGAGVAVDCFGVSDQVLRSEAARVMSTLAHRGEEMRQEAVALCEREFVWARYTDRVRAAYAQALRWN